MMPITARGRFNAMTKKLKTTTISCSVENKDITERKRAEEALANSRDEIKRILDLIPDMICTASPDGYFLSVNPAFVKTLGYSQAELLATSYLDLMHPDDRKPTMAEVQRQLADQPTAHF